MIYNLADLQTLPKFDLGYKTLDQFSRTSYESRNFNMWNHFFSIDFDLQGQSPSWFVYHRNDDIRGIVDIINAWCLDHYGLGGYCSVWIDMKMWFCFKEEKQAILFKLTFS